MKLRLAAAHRSHREREEDGELDADGRHREKHPQHAFDRMQRGGVHIHHVVERNHQDRQRVDEGLQLLLEHDVDIRLLGHHGLLGLLWRFDRRFAQMERLFRYHQAGLLGVVLRLGEVVADLCHLLPLTLHTIGRGGGEIYREDAVGHVGTSAGSRIAEDKSNIFCVGRSALTRTRAVCVRDVNSAGRDLCCKYT